MQSLSRPTEATLLLLLNLHPLHLLLLLCPILYLMPLIHLHILILPKPLLPLNLSPLVSINDVFG